MTKEQLALRQKVRISGLYLASETYGTVIGWADYGDIVEAEVVLVTGIRRGDVATIKIDRLHQVPAIPNR
jgi:hypothetical protein